LLSRTGAAEAAQQRMITMIEKLRLRKIAIEKEIQRRFTASGTCQSDCCIWFLWVQQAEYPFLFPS
jgi:hypothetical protein